MSSLPSLSKSPNATEPLSTPVNPALLLVNMPLPRLRQIWEIGLPLVSLPVRRMSGLPSLSKSPHATEPRATPGSVVLSRVKLAVCACAGSHGREIKKANAIPLQRERIFIGLVAWLKERLNTSRSRCQDQPDL